jgi:HEAT repeat protein
VLWSVAVLFLCNCVVLGLYRGVRIRAVTRPARSEAATQVRELVLALDSPDLGRSQSAAAEIGNYVRSFGSIITAPGTSGLPDWDWVAAGMVGVPAAETHVIPLLEASDPELRAWSARALATSLPQDPTTLGAMERGLGSADAAVAAWSAIGLAGSGRADMTDRLIRLVESDAHGLRSWAVSALTEVAPRALPPEKARALLDDAVETVRYSAALLLASRDDEAGLNALLQFARNPEPRVKRDAILALATARDGAVADSVGELLRSGDALDRVSGCMAYCSLGPENTPAATDAARALLTDADPGLRAWAAAALANSGDTSAIGELGPALRSADPNLFAAAARGASWLGEGAAQVAPEVGKRLSDPDARIRVNAVRCLGDLGAKGRPYRDGLRGLLSDRDLVVRTGAAISLVALGDESGVQPLASALADPTLSVRIRADAAYGLRYAGALPADAREQLKGALSDPDRVIANHAAIALGLQGDDAGRERLAGLLEAKGVETRVWAAYALARVADERGKTSAAALEGSEDPEVSHWVGRVRARLAVRASGESGR